MGKYSKACMHAQVFLTLIAMGALSLASTDGKAETAQFDEKCKVFASAEDRA